MPGGHARENPGEMLPGVASAPDEFLVSAPGQEQPDLTGKSLPNRRR